MESSTAAVLAKAQVTLQSGLPLGDWVHAEGAGTMFGVQARCTLVFGPQGEFAFHADGASPMAWGCDGARGWLRDSTGMPRAMEPAELALFRAVADLISGNWTRLSPELFTIADDVGLSPALHYEAGAETAPATLVLDLSTMLCHEIRLQRAFGLEKWQLTFSDDLRFPSRIDQVLPGDFRNTVRIDSVAPGDVGDRRFCAFPGAIPEDALWRDDAPSALAVQRGASGFMIVPVKLNGCDALFVIDSGAAVNVVHPAFAEIAGLRETGQSWMPSATGSGVARRWRASSLDLGPVELRNLWFTDLDLTVLSNVCGMEIRGILGYDLFMRSIVELDLQTPAISIRRDPAHLPRNTVWSPLSLYSNRPHVAARFGAPDGQTGEGLFRLDTGAPKVAVLFNAPVTRRFGLADAEGMQAVRLPLPGGAVDTTVGVIPWFEFGGRRTEHVRAICVKSEGTGFADPVCAGNLGQAILGEHKLTFHYRGARIAIA